MLRGEWTREAGRAYISHGRVTKVLVQVFFDKLIYLMSVYKMSKFL